MGKSEALRFLEEDDLISVVEEGGESSEQELYPFDDPDQSRDEKDQWFKEPRTAGGPGSGNFGHAGRPGEVGGSAAWDAGGAQPTRAWTTEDGFASRMRDAEFNPDQERDENGRWTGGDVQTFFHGTADRFVEKIRAEGLKSEATRSDASSDFRVYMTPDRALAVRYAKTAAALGKSIGTPVLIQIRVPAEHAAKIGLAERQPTDGSVAVTYPTDIPPSWIVGVEIDGETGWRSLATGGRTIWAVAFIKEPRSAEFNPDQPRDEP
jgi:hypothetical protein